MELLYINLTEISNSFSSNLAICVKKQGKTAFLYRFFLKIRNFRL